MKIFRCKHPVYKYFCAEKSAATRKYFKSYVEAKAFLVSPKKTVGPSLSDVEELALRDLSEVSSAHKSRVFWVYKFMCNKLRMPLNSVKETDIDEILNHYTNSNSRACMYRYARLIWRKLHRAGVVERDLFLNIKMPRTVPRQVCLTIDQTMKLLTYPMPTWLRATFVIGLFAGLRSSEIERMDWADIDWRRESIIVRPGVAKGVDALTSRIVPMTPPILRRVELLQGVGRVVPHATKTFHAHRSAIGAAALGTLHWPKGALRHTFATYHLALTRNAGTTAYYMGHTSSDMVNRVYALPAHSVDAEAFWSL